MRFGMALSQRWKDILRRVLLVFHVVLAAGILVGGIVEFAVQPPLFDVAGDRIGIKDHVFQVLSALVSYKCTQ